ncbi:hypothetical protein [Bernardetia sp.]|uniref:hypothetical protein n=1 Tax=Bernardetia sp. TaxID=1937974 RepID=UPI0025C2ABF1|nr:hypothetical protein [Bernardetia sp.]
MEHQIRLAIKKALDSCDSEKMPHVCQSKQIKGGYKRLESLVLKLMIKNEFTPSEAIAHIENENL